MIDTSMIVCVDSGCLAPAREQTTKEVVQEHKAEPIKSTDDLKRISQYFIGQGDYRDNMLFVAGINFGLRISDLLELRFSDILNDDLSFKTSFPVLEKKTKNTRKSGKNRYITINRAVTEAVTLFLQHHPSSLSDYMFRSESNHGKSKNKPMNKSTAYRALVRAGEALELKEHISTHTLRKTFGYHQMRMSGNDPKKLLLLQKIFGHSTAAQTLDYIGLTSDEIKLEYLKLNLCGTDEYDEVQKRSEARASQFNTERFRFVYELIIHHIIGCVKCVRDLFGNHRGGK